MTMRIDIITLFPELCEAVMGESIVGRARKKGAIEVYCHQLREYTYDKHNRVDDTPYGGGMGMLLMAEPIADCFEHVCEQAGRRPYLIYMSPQGKTLTQQRARELAEYDSLAILCGHYEGVDQRFLDECVDEEISMGDFVLTGGEIPAMAVADAVCRMVPGVLPDAECFEEESHWNGLLEYPQYSRPAEWHGRAVPEILLSGDHGKVAAWRKKQSYKRTMERRPDLFAKFDKSQLTSKADKKILAEAEAEFVAEHPDCAAERAES